MQVRQFISFLVAAAAVASAFECTFSNGNTLPDFVLEDFNEYSRIASKIGSNVALEMMYNSSLVKRQAKKMICMSGPIPAFFVAVVRQRCSIAQYVLMLR